MAGRLTDSLCVLSTTQ